MDDKSLIKSLGGPAELARKLGYDLHKGGIQRVQNWISRGIPARVKLERPDLFLGLKDKRNVYQKDACNTKKAGRTAPKQRTRAAK